MLLVFVLGLVLIADFCVSTPSRTGSSFEDLGAVLLFAPHVRCRPAGPLISKPQCLLQLQADDDAVSAIGDNITLEPVAATGCYVGRFAYPLMDAVLSSLSMRRLLTELVNENANAVSQFQLRLGLHTGLEQLLNAAAPLDLLGARTHFRGLTSLSRPVQIDFIGDREAEEEVAPFARVTWINSANWKFCLNHAGGIHFNRSAKAEDERRCVIGEYLTHACVVVDGSSLRTVGGCADENGSLLRYSRLATASASRLSLRDSDEVSKADRLLWAPLTVHVCDSNHAGMGLQAALRAAKKFVVLHGANFADRNVQNDDMWNNIVARSEEGSDISFVMVAMMIALLFGLIAALIFIVVKA
jgi:hypothetical protein